MFDRFTGAGRVVTGVITLLAGMLTIMSLMAVPSVSTVPVILALVGVALLVAGTLAIGTSNRGRSA